MGRCLVCGLSAHENPVGKVRCCVVVLPYWVACHPLCLHGVHVSSSACVACSCFRMAVQYCSCRSVVAAAAALMLSLMFASSSVVVGCPSMASSSWAGVQVVSWAWQWHGSPSVSWCCRHAATLSVCTLPCITRTAVGASSRASLFVPLIAEARSFLVFGGMWWGTRGGLVLVVVQAWLIMVR